MMEQIRNATKSWLAMVVVGFLVISFAIWGVNDVFSPDPNPPVAHVGDQEVTQEMFVQELTRAFQQVQQRRGPGYTQADALDDGLHRDTLDNLIRQMAVLQAADALGMTTSDGMLREEIIRNPAFAGPTGQFEQSSYAELLRANGYTPQFYETQVRNQITTSQLFGTLASGFYLPGGLVLSHYQYAFERREVSYFLLSPAAAGEVADPGDEALEEYYTRNTNNYRAPEYRALTVLKLDIEELADQVEVPEEHIRQLYDIRHDFLQVPETREIEQLSFPSREAAETALNLLNAGGDFENVGGTYVDLGDVAQNEGIDEAVMEEAFALTEPGTTDVIDGALSYVIARVNSITPGEATTYEEVRDELRQELAEQTASEEIFAISENVQDALAGGEDFADIGDRLNIPVIAVEAVDRNGMTPDGDEVTALTSTPGMIEAAFDLTEGEDTGFRDTPDGDFYVARLDSIAPAHVQSFEEVRDAVLDDWRQDQIAERLAAMADDAASQINGGVSLANVAASLGREVRETPRPIRRGDTSEIFSGSTLEELFTSETGRAIAGPVFLGSSYLVAQVTNVIPADPDAEDAQVDTLQTALEDRVAAELINAYADNAREQVNVRINEQALSQVVSNFN